VKILSEMNRSGLIFLLSLLTVAATAQKDPEAVRILSEFSRKATQAPSVKIDFSINAENEQDGESTTMEGTAVISGDSYRLTMADNIIWADGSAVWNYIPDANEVTITEPDPDDDSFMSKPSVLFSLYKEGYKVRLLDQNEREWIIDLYPEDIRVNLVRIRLSIGKRLYDLKSAEYRTKDGMNVMLTAEKYDLGFRPADGYFTFRPADYKGVDIVDMR
jgi:outer membrane lipoprotein-sorting protein